MTELILFGCNMFAIGVAVCGLIDYKKDIILQMALAMNLIMAYTVFTELLEMV